MRRLWIAVAVLAASSGAAAEKLHLVVQNVEGQHQTSAVTKAIELQPTLPCFKGRDTATLELSFSVLANGSIVGRKVLSSSVMLAQCVASKLRISPLAKTGGTTRVSARIEYATRSLQVESSASADLEQYLHSVPGPRKGKLRADFKTNKGTIHCVLYPQDAPITVANFIGLALGLKAFRVDDAPPVRRRYYDGLTFHRVIPNFMIQGGDPKGNGTGGPGYKFVDEQNQHRFDRVGVLAMANAGPNTNGSQFFITEKPVRRLDGRYTIFGRCQNHDLVRKIARVPTSMYNRPIKPVVIKRLEIYRR